MLVQVNDDLVINTSHIAVMNRDNNDDKPWRLLSINGDVICDLTDNEVDEIFCVAKLQENALFTKEV